MRWLSCAPFWIRWRGGTEMVVMLLEWVFTSAFLILVVLALRAALGKRVSARLRYALWAVVLLRLLVPVQLFSSPLAGTWVFSGAETKQDVYTVPAPPASPSAPVISLPEADAAPGMLPSAPKAPALPDAPEPPALPNLTKAPVWLGWIWLAGSAAVALVLLVSNLRFYWRLRRERVLLEGMDCPLRIYEAAGLPSPCLFGLPRPAIYVTPEAAAVPDMLRHVLAHEATHYKHGDHIWSLLRCAALTVHWWNPLVWLAAALSQRDGELACDEGTLCSLGDGERLAYGNTLLALVTARPGPTDLMRCATTMAGDKKSLKERITRIAQTPKRWLWAAVAVVLVTALACVCAFGQAAPEETEDGSDGFIPAWPYGASEMTYVRDAGGFGGDFTITLRHDGSFSYYEGLLSSYIGMGTWGRKDGVIRLADEVLKDSAGIQYYYFKIVDGGLVFQAENSAKFMYVDVADGERFSRKDAAGEPADLTAHFPADTGSVPPEVLNAIGQDAQGKYEQFLLNLDGHPIAVGNSGKPEFDGWRVKTLDGPWSRTVLGMDVEIWRTFCEYHTPEPEKAKYMLAGGMYVTEDGWFSPEDWRNYYIFSLDQTGGRSLAAIMPMGAGGGAPDGETQMLRDDFDAMVERALADTRAVDPSGLAPDLNRNGVPEELRVMSIDGGAGEKLEVWENGKLLYEEEGYFAHAGYNALFLYHDGDGDYLLRYNPYMAQGWGTYSYRLFTLNEHGASTARYVDLNFDLNFEPMMQESHQFYVNEIVRFMNEINGLLAHSVQLINTDEDLLATFEENGRLYDDLSWLDWWKPAYVRGGQALADELWRFQSAMEKQHDTETPVVSNPGEESTSGGEPRDLLLTYQGRTKWFSADWEQFYPDDTADGQLIDLDGDGNMEIVVSLAWGHGTGCYGEHLYIFDAETLEQYDTSGLEDMILSQVTSYAGEDRFYVSAPGLEAEIEKPDGDYYYYNDSVSFGDYYRFQVKNGRLYGRFGAALDRADVCYCGTLEVELRLDGKKLICAGFEYLTEGVDD